MLLPELPQHARLTTCPVLVTRLNGIRKTSVGQPWFKELLRQALGHSLRVTLTSCRRARIRFFVSWTT